MATVIELACVLCSAPPGVFLPPNPWAWVDPGAFALIGAGAFMGGVTRLTISLAVIMMEVSQDYLSFPSFNAHFASALHGSHSEGLRTSHASINSKTYTAMQPFFRMAAHTLHSAERNSAVL